MGLFTWIIIAVLILSIIGLGWQTFVGGVFKGGEKIINSNPEIKNVTQKVKQYIINHLLAQFKVKKRKETKKNYI
jgi:uncharacterized membrane protein